MNDLQSRLSSRPDFATQIDSFGELTPTQLTSVSDTEGAILLHIGGILLTDGDRVLLCDSVKRSKRKQGLTADQLVARFMALSDAPVLVCLETCLTTPVYAFPASRRLLLDQFVSEIDEALKSISERKLAIAICPWTQSDWAGPGTAGSNANAGEAETASGATLHQLLFSSLSSETMVLEELLNRVVSSVPDCSCLETRGWRHAAEIALRLPKPVQEIDPPAQEEVLAASSGTAASAKVKQPIQSEPSSSNLVGVDQVGDSELVSKGAARFVSFRRSLPSQEELQSKDRESLRDIALELYRTQLEPLYDSKTRSGRLAIPGRALPPDDWARGEVGIQQIMLDAESHADRDPPSGGGTGLDDRVYVNVIGTLRNSWSPGELFASRLVGGSDDELTAMPSIIRNQTVLGGTKDWKAILEQLYAFTDRQNPEKKCLNTLDEIRSAT
ncbi:MAG: hypothetical protein AAGG44_20455, partial [Planctomycetota bacterium]